MTLFAVLSRVSVKASAVLLLCVPLIPLSIVVVQKIAKRLLDKYWSVYTGLGDSFLENLQGLTTLKIYQADQQKAQEMDEEAQQFRSITMKVLTMQLNSTSVMDIMAYGGAAVGMIEALREFARGEIGLAGVLTILLLAAEFFIPLQASGLFFSHRDERNGGQRQDFCSSGYAGTGAGNSRGSEVRGGCPFCRGTFFL